jgi:hypothetical protein
MGLDHFCDRVESGVDDGDPIPELRQTARCCPNGHLVLIDAEKLELRCRQQDGFSVTASAECCINDQSRWKVSEVRGDVFQHDRNVVEWFVALCGFRG